MTIQELQQYIVKPNHVLVLRTSNKDREAYNNFQYPELGFVEAPDWNNNDECGGGLHGLVWGEGNKSHFSRDSDCVYQILEVDLAVLRTGNGDLTDKCKFQKGEVLFTGPIQDALPLLYCHKDNPNKKNFASGTYSTSASSGYQSTSASSGYQPTSASLGYQSTSASSGYQSTSASSGYNSTSASSGDYSTSASSGDYSTSASSGNHSTSASSGENGIAASIGNGGKVKAGPNG